MIVSVYFSGMDRSEIAKDEFEAQKSDGEKIYFHRDFLADKDPAATFARRGETTVHFAK